MHFSLSSRVSPVRPPQTSPGRWLLGTWLSVQDLREDAGCLVVLNPAVEEIEVSIHPMPGILWVVRGLPFGKRFLAMQQSEVLGGGPPSPTGDFASCQPMHAFLSQVQRHVEVVRPALAISITTEGEITQNGDKGFTPVSNPWPGFRGRPLESEALPSHRH